MTDQGRRGPSYSDTFVGQADRCVACGACLPVCPTYRLLGTEADSPRGRLFMLKESATHHPEAVAGVREHLERCLLCGACQSICPAQVPYVAAISSARGEKRFRKRSLRETVLLRAARSSALVAALGYLGAAVPGPAGAPVRFPAVLPALGVLRGEVQLFLGCFARITDQAALRAAAYLLQRQGFTVRLPLGQGCCGALHRHRGEDAADLLARNLAAFDPSLPTVVAATGCAGTLMQGFAREGRQVYEATAFLAGNWRREEVGALKVKVAVHLPCSMRHGLGDRESSMQLLTRIPGIRLELLDTPCCGGAGSYMVLQPRMAAGLRGATIEAIRSSGASIVATANVGCALHLGQGLREEGLPVEAIHPLVLLARQMEWRE